MTARKANVDALWAELVAAVRSAPRPPSPKPRASTPAQRRRRLDRLRAALVAKDLAAVRKALPRSPDEALNQAQATAIYAYGARLEIGSAGLSIVFDRFDRRELRLTSSALAAIGARRTRDDLRALERALAGAVARGQRRRDASEWLSTRPRTRRVDARSDAHVAEIERRLLVFCRAHLDELAA